MSVGVTLLGTGIELTSWKLIELTIEAPGTPGTANGNTGWRGVGGFESALGFPNSIEIGRDTYGMAANAIAIGGQVIVSGSGGIALGIAAFVNDVDAIAIGRLARAVHPQAIAIGLQANANGLDVLALGNGADANQDNSVAIGNLAVVSSGSTILTWINSVVVGAEAHAAEHSVVVVGFGSEVAGSLGVVIGADSSIAAGGAYGVLLGSGHAIQGTNAARTIMLGGTSVSNANEVTDVCLIGHRLAISSTSRKVAHTCVIGGWDVYRYETFLFGQDDKAAGESAALYPVTFRLGTAAFGTTSTYTNLAGSDWTFEGSRGTGTGVRGQMVFKVAQVATAGTTLHALATRLTIKEAGVDVGGTLTINGATVYPGRLEPVTETSPAWSMPRGWHGTQAYPPVGPEFIFDDNGDVVMAEV